ncbi:MAG TPA: hypothetical protein VL197_11890 [Nitrospirota bacterium]|nr:hypothetical protein [Nitrospirota bacterium]
MNVVEKDKVISGMLQDELMRCREMLAGLQKSAASLPKGVLQRRKKRYKNKSYSYYALKFRDGEKVVNQHIPSDQVPVLLKKLEHRKKIDKESRAYQNKIAYLSKILKACKR